MSAASVQNMYGYKCLSTLTVAYFPLAIFHSTSHPFKLSKLFCSLDDNERESLQLTTDGGEEEAGVVSARTFGEVFRRAADELQSVVEEYTDSVTDSEDPTEAIGSLLRVLDDVFDVTEEQRQGVHIIELVYTL